MRKFLKWRVLLFFMISLSLWAEIILDNNSVKLIFEENNYALVRVETDEAIYYFNPQESPLWAITIFDSTANPVKLSNLSRYNSTQINANKSFEIIHSSNEKILRLKWENIDILGTGKVSVIVTIKLKENTSESYWKIKVKNNSSRYSVFHIDFPYISFATLYSGGKLNTLAFPSYAGCIFYNPEKSAKISANLNNDLNPEASNFKVTYPGNVSMQFSYLYDRGAKKGLYLSPLDKKGFIKRYHIVGKGSYIEYFIRQYPENNHLPNQDYTQPYDFILLPLSGDWIDACKFYRDSFTKNTPWTSQGKIYEREDERKYGPESPLILWWEISSSLDEMINIVLNNKDFFSVDLGVHIRNSGWAKFLSEDYLSSLFIEFCQSLANYGVRTAPYTSTRAWQSEFWPDPRAESAVARTINNEPYYSPKWDHYVMCPFSHIWKTLYPEKVNYLLQHAGATDVYMDNYPLPKLCYQKSHNHSLGGGTYWLDGYKAMSDRIRKSNPQAAMANESRAEMLIPWLDIFPAGYWQNPEGVKPFVEIGSYPIPMVACVYHDYVGFLGSASKDWEEYNTYQFAFQQGYAFVNGNKLNLRACEDKIENFPSKKLRDWNYVKTLTEYIIAAADYLYYGRWERPPQLKNFPNVTVRFPDSYPEMYQTLNTSSVLAGVFKSPEGRLGLVFTNFTDLPASGSFSVNLDYYNMPSEFYRVYELSSSGTVSQTDNFTGSYYEKDLSLPEKSVKFLIITDQLIDSESKKSKKRR
ncbi:MAG: DUF6259 domain-containing protein [Candidatus Aminicenantia bacterium]